MKFGVWTGSAAALLFLASSALPLRGQGKVVSPQGASANSTNGANEAQPAGDPEPPAGAAEPASESTADRQAANAPAQRTTLNLLGQTDTRSGESRRNENVQFNLVDNNALKEMNIRLGATATIVEEFQVDRGYFGAEYGSAPRPTVHATASRGSAVHGNLMWGHNNSIFSARSFFQVGKVRPARENTYGGALSLPVWRGAFLSLGGSQNKIRGNVNGNVLIPLPEERTPLTNDPALRPIVEGFLNAYPEGPPNRPDIAKRAHNTNSLQRINTDSARGQLDQELGDSDRLIFRYTFTNQNVDAFQFVKGQNPDTDTKSHGARITWSRTWGANTLGDFSIGFDRLGSLLLPAEGAVGPLNLSETLTTLGPSPTIPIDRAQNRFRYAATVRHTRGRHFLTAGAALTRLQYNGEEPDGARGNLSIRDDFGNDTITNLRLGLPSQLNKLVGTTYRGYRNWDTQLFLGDRWQATHDLTLSFGLRYEPSTRPYDVTGRSHLAYDSDLNNWAGSFGFAQRLPGRWGVLRGAYGLIYGQIFPVTYGQDRLNPPFSLRVSLNAPNLADPLGGLDFEDLDPNGRASKIEVGPDLATPYSHQYNFSWEFELAADWRLQLGYVGSRSHKLIMTYFLNRARYIEGVEFTSRTINDRRPDHKLFEYLFTHNGSRGFYDAGRVSLIAPRWRGLTINASYWYGKAIDIGGDYTNTASGQDARVAIGQTEAESQRDLRGVSNFHQPHSLLLQAGYETPRLGSAESWLQRVFGSWNLSGVGLLKSGTPFTVEAGSDGPGLGNVDGVRNDRVMLLDAAVLGRTIGDPDTASQLLPRSAFRFMHAPEEIAGNLGRNTFRKGKIANVNAMLWKIWPVRNDTRITLRAESINLFNTPQFAEPGRSLVNPNFGQINNTLNDGRTFRFTLQVDF
jgi:hypothetical protein